MTRPDVVVLLTCHERVHRTVACLDALLHGQRTTGPVKLEVVLVDADSQDGTADAVERAFPQVTVLRRSSELFWNAGMRVAWDEARRRDPDHYLWLNDDVLLDAGALEHLLRTHAEVHGRVGRPAIITGTTRDPDDGTPTYGGVERPSPRSRPLRFTLVPPSADPRPAETTNGNCVLVPREVAERVGNLSPAFTHGMGDFDYGLRARRAGFEVWVAPGTIGTCARNPSPRIAATLDEHRRRATGVTTGLPPREWARFAWRWAGPLWPVFALSPYVRGFARWSRTRRR